MEIQKTKEELMAFLESSGANSLVDFLGSSSSVNLAIADQLDDLESSSSSEVEETIEDAREDARDDEDFIILMEPKTKKKLEKKSLGVIRPSVPKSKRKCEFCGTMETPMWRRGPTGKGTLCNACGVKWSLKFRKRAGKKASKSEKIRDDASQQRHSTRKKLVSSKQSDQTDLMVDHPPKEESSSTHQHINGLCCNHSKKRKEREEQVGDNEADWKKRRDANLEYDSLSDDASPQNNQLFGKLLNVVEVQLVEEEELERIKAQMRILRQDLETNEATQSKQLEQVKIDSIDHLQKLKSDVLGIHLDRSEKIAKECGDIVHAFMKNIQDARTAISSNGALNSNDLAKIESEVNQMTQLMDAKLAKMAKESNSDLLRIQTLFLNQEDTIKSKWSVHRQETQTVFAQLHDRMEIIEDPIMKTV